MKALVKYGLGPDGVKIMDIEKPSPKANEILMKVVACGICGSDIHSLHDQRDLVMPVALGHEYVGIVEEVGSEVTGLKVGDYVTGLPACYSCDSCVYCTAGEVTLCKERKSVGTHKNGAMAEYMVCPAKYCFKIPDDDQNKEKYAMTEPFACAVRGTYEIIKVKEGDIAVVSGPGTIGLFIVQCLLAQGARVIVSGLPQDEPRLAKAVELGAEKYVTNTADLEAYLTEIAPLGADIAVECAGATPSLDICLKVVKTHGQVLMMGVFPKPIQVDVNKIFMKELKVYSSNSTAMSTWKIALDLLYTGKIDISFAMSLKLPLDDWKKGFDAVINKSALKVLLFP